MSDDGRTTARQWPPGRGRLIVVAPSMRTAEAWAAEQGLDAGRWVGVHRLADVRLHVQDDDDEFVVLSADRAGQARVQPVVDALLQRGKRRRD